MALKLKLNYLFQGILLNVSLLILSKRCVCSNITVGYFREVVETLENNPQ